MSDLKTELELAQRLFGSSTSGGLGAQGLRRVTATATSDSSGGTVTVNVGGEAIEVPVIGAVSTGDEVTLVVDDGAPTAIGVDGWGDVVQQAADTAEQAALEAQQVAEAIDQHFWTDTSGAHVTEVEQDDWNDSTSQDYHSGANILLNSQGQLLRDGLDTLASFTTSGVNFYDSNGDTTASFNSSGVVIGKDQIGSKCITIDDGSIEFINSTQQHHRAPLLSIYPVTDQTSMQYGDTVLQFLPGGTTLYEADSRIIGGPHGVSVESGNGGSVWMTSSYPETYASAGDFLSVYTQLSQAGETLTGNYVTDSPGYATCESMHVSPDGNLSTQSLKLTKQTFYATALQPPTNAVEVYSSQSAASPSFSVGWDGSVSSTKYGASTSGSWTVEKRPGGIIEATRTITGSLAVTSSYAGRYISALQSTSLPPGLFSTIDWAGVEVAYSPGLWDAHLTTVSKSTVNYYIACNASTTANITRRVYVRGR